MLKSLYELWNEVRMNTYVFQYTVVLFDLIYISFFSSGIKSLISFLTLLTFSNFSELFHSLFWKESKLSVWVKCLKVPYIFLMYLCCPFRLRWQLNSCKCWKANLVTTLNRRMSRSTTYYGYVFILKLNIAKLSL